MAGTTNPMGFPYPTGTDRVADGDNAMQSLAEAVDDAMAGIDAAPVPGAGVTIGNTRVYRRGRVVVLRIEGLVIPAIGAGAVLLTVPVGYRVPTGVKFFGTVLNSTGAQAAWTEVRDTGGLHANVATGAATLYGTQVWAV